MLGSHAPTRPVQSTPALQSLAGKEGNKLLERLSGEVTDPADYRADYGARDDSWSIVVDAIRLLDPGPVARRSGLDRRTIQRAVRKHPEPTTPHRTNRAKIAQLPPPKPRHVSKPPDVRRQTRFCRLS